MNTDLINRYHNDNALIAEYVGAENRGFYDNKEHGKSYIFYYGKNAIVPLNWSRVHSTGSMKYDKLYDWIMPVLDKMIKDNLCHQDDFVEHLFEIKKLYAFVIETLSNEQNK